MTKTLKISIAVSAVVLSSATFAAGTTHVFQQKQEGSMEKKDEQTTPPKYDFSLFKFISTPKVEQKDSTIKTQAEELKKTVFLREETTELYEKPRSFFMFS